ncbi:MAG TPA: glycine betaine ABC transporter substrate-binding protein [Rubrobacteraceae bacterium]|nr:glycine betaine ABC transporter substrate-binding protein [Rubrobacteraceae bacterium]
MQTVILALLIGMISFGCSGAGSSGKTLRIGIQEWDENVAISNLTKVLLEEDLGYDKVELQVLPLPDVFEGVGDGDLDAFQDVWMPNHKDRLSEVSAGVDHLPAWFRGKTAYGIAVPDYMSDVKSLNDLNRAGTDMIFGIEPTAAFMPKIEKKVIPGYDPDIKLVASSTPAMLAELKNAYDEKEPIIFLGWSPHWMNATYKFRYLKDPKGLEKPFSDPSKLSTIVRKDLKEDDPVAYQLIKSISLTEEQVNALEAEINASGDPVKGVESWLADNRSVVTPWIDRAEKTQES